MAKYTENNSSESTYIVFIGYLIYVPELSKEGADFIFAPCTLNVDDRPRRIKNLNPNVDKQEHRKKVI